MEFDELEIFFKNLSTLKETSRETQNGEICFMVDSPVDAINFDGVKDDYIRFLGLCDHPKSNDALIFLENNDFVFIEFKSGVIYPKDIYDIRKKIYDSTLIFTDIIHNGITYMRHCVDYYLVYDDSKNIAATKPGKDTMQHSESRTKIAKSISSRAKQNFVEFGLEPFQGYCFRKVLTIPLKEFATTYIYQLQHNTKKRKAI